MALDASILAVALLGAAAVAFTRQRAAVLAVCGGLFVPVAAVATVAAWWPISPALTVALLCATLGVSTLTLLLYLIDRVFAPFCIEMTYPALACWVLWPLLVMVDFLALLLQ